MKLFEKILTVMIIVGLIFKFAFISGGSTLFVLGISFLSIIYYPLGLLFFNDIPMRKAFKKISYQGISTLKIIGAIGLGMGLSAILIGILFKLQHFPGSLLMLYTGLIVTMIVAVISIMKYLENRYVFYKKTLTRIAIIGIIGLFLTSLSSEKIEKFQYRNYPRYIEALDNYIENPENIELQNRLEVERMRVHLRAEEFKAYYPDEK